MKTTIDEIKKFISTEVDLSFMTQKNAGRLNYYLDTFFVKEEKDRLKKSFDFAEKEMHNSFSNDFYKKKTFDDFYKETFDDNVEQAVP